MAASSAPRREEHSKVAAINIAITVEIGGARYVTARAPLAEQHAEVGAVGGAVAIEVAAIKRWAGWPRGTCP